MDDTSQEPDNKGGHRKQKKSKKKKSTEEQNRVVVIGKLGAESESDQDQSQSTEFHKPLARAFFVALVFGIMAECYGYILVAAATMAIYFIYGLTRSKRMRNNERFADSLYYLGFILTLWALFLGMVPEVRAFLPGLELTEALTSQSIISNFGIALITTFLGMTLRICLIQLTPTVSDQDEDVRESMAQYVEKMDEEISAAIKSISEFREEFSTGLESVGKISDDFFTQRLSGTTDALAGNINELSDLLKKNTQNFASSLSGSGNVMSEMKGKIEALEASISDANENLSQIAQISSETVQGTAKFAQSAGDAASAMDGFKASAADLSEMLTTLNSQLQNQGAEYETKLKDGIESIQSAATDLQSGVEQYEDSVVSSSEKILGAVKSLRREI
jgi:hypothetical protein